MVSDHRSLGFVGTDDSDIVQVALPSSFVDNRATSCPKLHIQDEVLHPLWKITEKSQVKIVDILRS